MPGMHHRSTIRRVKVFNLLTTMVGMGFKRKTIRLLRLKSLTRITANTMLRKQKLLFLQEM